MSSSCIFCEIANKNLSCDLLFEDEKVVVFRDIRPKKPTHVLFVSKEHIVSLADMSDSQISIIPHLFNVIRKFAFSHSLTGYSLQINVGKEGGQEIPHLHIHLLSNTLI